MVDLKPYRRTVFGIISQLGLYLGYIGNKGITMDATLQGVRDLYTVVGFGGGVLIVLVGLFAVIWRSGVRAKDDPTPKLVDVIKQGQDTNRELTTEFVEGGKRQDTQSKAHVHALTAIADEMKEGRKVQTGLVEVVQSVSTNLVQTRADINEIAIKQAARAADLHGEVLTTINDAQEAVLTEFKRLIDVAINEIKAALKPLQHRRGTSDKFKQAVKGINDEIRKLQADVKNLNLTPPQSVAPVVAPAVPDDGIKPHYSVIRTSNPQPVKPSANGASADLDRYPGAPGWIRDRR